MIYLIKLPRFRASSNRENRATSVISIRRELYITYDRYFIYFRYYLPDCNDYRVIPILVRELSNYNCYNKYPII